MRPPTVLEGREVEIRELVPPPRSRWAPHKWLGGRGLRIGEREGERIELFISKVAEEKMRNHASAHEHREVMGFMLGGIYSHDGKEYALARDIVTTDLEASSVRVRFDREAFEGLFRSLDECGFNYIIVGWYHSHPGHGCFMSTTDIETQRTLFGKRHHTALVIDPVNRDIEGYFMDGGDVRERAFAIYWDEYQDPYSSRTVRRRKTHSDPDGVPLPERGLGLPQPFHENGDEGVEE